MADVRAQGGAFLVELRAAGFTLRAVAGGLEVSPRGRLSGPLREAIRRERAGLLAAEASDFTGPPGWVRWGRMWFDPSSYDPDTDPFDPPGQGGLSG
jgi:hypothetical protein